MVTTAALLFSTAIGNLIPTGAGFNANPATLDAAAVTTYAGQAKAQTVTDFLLQMIPVTVVDAFARGSILSVVLVSLLFGFALSSMGARCKPLIDVIEALTQVVFGVVNILMRFAPIGAFGAMAFTVGRYGLGSLGPLDKVVLTSWASCTVLVVA